VCRPLGDSRPIIRLKDTGVRPTEIASRLGIGRASVYRVLGEQETTDDHVAA
jgi:DNA invertase Pin-like site-specific DNA recombinase